MKRKLRACALAVAVLAAGTNVLVSALSAAASGRVHHIPVVTVKPGAGSPTTRFLVSFRAPDAAGRNGPFDIRYQVTADGKGSACASAVGADVGTVRKGAVAHAKLSAAPGRWCVAAYHGRVQELRAPHCAPGQVCAQYLVVRTIGRFRFTVRAHRPGADGTPPSFAGLQRASACTPGPQRPGQTTPYTLSWTAAADDVTPTDKIVYDIFMSSSPGGEDFSHPSWTTPPGATSYRTPGLPSHAQVYFVVRARDRAGNEDQNHVERAGVDPCV